MNVTYSGYSESFWFNGFFWFDYPRSDFWFVTVTTTLPAESSICSGTSSITPPTRVLTWT